MSNPRRASREVSRVDGVASAGGGEDAEGDASTAKDRLLRGERGRREEGRWSGSTSLALPVGSGAAFGRRESTFLVGGLLRSSEHGEVTRLHLRGVDVRVGVPGAEPRSVG
jgi:hypothetical protein